jgi:protein disulfide-isomerase-like protein
MVKLLILALCLCNILILTVNAKKDLISVDDIKEWKKLLRTRTNILSLFAATKKSAEDILPVLEKVATEIKGKGAVIFVDCSDAKKLCKNLKISPQTYLLKHYKDGSYHKDYDRLLRKSSFIDFMLDPTRNTPWSEDPTSKDIRHIDTSTGFYKMLSKERKPILAMFYAPWCGHCQRMKPEFALAAAKLKGKAVLAAMDLDRPEGMLLREEYNVTGFPTVLYFEKGKLLYPYWGERDEESIVEWIKNPKPPPVQEETPQEEANWSDELADIDHLNTQNFDEFIKANPSVLVAFYAPWCGHCKAMKPGYNEAAKIIQSENITGRLAAVDATQENDLAQFYNVQGFPTIKYFKDGEMMYDYGFARTTEAFVNFMKDPQAPPPPEKDWSEMESEVHHLTDENFKSFTKKTKHTLVMFYAPWCGHCKAAKPHYMAAAEELKDNRKTALGAVDCTKYPKLCTSHEVEGYPTIKYFNYGKKSVNYMGSRDTEGFVKFMSDPEHMITTSKDEL